MIAFVLLCISLGFADAQGSGRKASTNQTDIILFASPKGFEQVEFRRGIAGRKNKLVDLLLDGRIDQQTYNDQAQRLALEIQAAEESGYDFEPETRSDGPRRSAFSSYRANSGSAVFTSFFRIALQQRLGALLKRRAA